MYNQTYKNAVLVRIFSNKQAYTNENNSVYGEVYDEGYILFYIKNLTDRGIHRGRNEIRWMQAKGGLSPLFGEKDFAPFN